MDVSNELIQLRAEVAALRQELTSLKRFLHVAEADDEQSRPSLMIDCTGIFLRSCKVEGDPLQGMLMAGDHGPFLSLWGSDGKARLKLEVQNDQPSITVLGPDLKTAVTLDTREHASRGMVAVYDQGQPRALLKANEHGGVVSVVHDDGLTRATMIGQHACGQFMVLNPDMKIAGSFSSDGPGGAGMFHVNSPVGKPVAALLGSSDGGILFTYDHRGNVIASVPSPPQPPDDADNDE